MVLNRLQEQIVKNSLQSKIQKKKSMSHPIKHTYIIIIHTINCYHVTFINYKLNIHIHTCLHSFLYVVSFFNQTLNNPINPLNPTTPGPI